MLKVVDREAINFVISKEDIAIGFGAGPVTTVGIGRVIVLEMGFASGHVGFAP